MTDPGYPDLVQLPNSFPVNFTSREWTWAPLALSHPHLPLCQGCRLLGGAYSWLQTIPGGGVEQNLKYSSAQLGLELGKNGAQENLLVWKNFVSKKNLGQKTILCPKKCWSNKSQRVIGFFSCSFCQAQFQSAVQQQLNWELALLFQVTITTRRTLT